MDYTALISLLSLITTTIGAGVIAYLAFKQKQLDSKLELARMESEAAKIAAEQTRIEARKRGAKQSRKVEALSQKTDDQTRILEDTKQHVAKLETQTNGMNERLIREVERSSLAAGKEAGKAESEEKRRLEHDVRNEENQKHLTGLLHKQQGEPQSVIIANAGPVPVEIKKHDK